MERLDWAYQSLTENLFSKTDELADTYNSVYSNADEEELRYACDF